MENFVYATGWVIIFILSATLHEAAHAWAAMLGGDDTAYLGGQVSLNPVPHIEREPIGMLVFPLVTALFMGWPYGYASAPYDPRWAYNHPRRAALMALAGPAANLFLAVMCGVTIRLGIMGGIFLMPDSIGFRHIVDPAAESWTGLSVFISMMFTLNLIMLVLNLIPLPPLDGSSIISLFLNERVAREYQQWVRNPIFGFAGLFLAWQLFDPIFYDVFPRVINILY